MILERNPNKLSCLACCIAMCCNTRVGDVYTFCQHKGDRIGKDGKYRGFTVLDILKFAKAQGYNARPADKTEYRSERYIVCGTRGNGSQHAVVISGGKVYDPDTPYPLSLELNPIITVDGIINVDKAV